MWGVLEKALNAIIPDRLARRTRNEILANYGNPDGKYQEKYCKAWEVKEDFPWFPAARIFINREFMAQLSEAFKQLEAEGLQHEIKTFDGCFVIRNTRGTALISLHSWAMAMDLNASVEKLEQKTTNWSDRFIEIMTAHVFWGGDFLSRKDNMHFSLYGE